MMDRMEEAESATGTARPAELAMRAWRARTQSPDDAIELADRVLRSISPVAPASAARAGVARAAALLTRHRAEEARASARDALALYSEAGGDIATQLDVHVVCEAHRCMVRSAFLLNDTAVAMSHAGQQLAAAERSADVGLRAVAHSDSAAVYGAIGLFEKALEHLHIGIGLIEVGGEGPLAAPLNNLGNVYLELDRPDEAMACFGRSRLAFGSMDNRLGAAIARSNEGRALVALGRFDEAIACLNESLHEFTDGGDVDYVPATHAKLAVTYARAGDGARAERSFEQAVGLHDQGVGRAFEMDTRRDFADFLINRQRDREALEQLLPALRMFRERTARAGVADVLGLLARAHENLGDAPAALDALKAYVEERETLERERGELRTQSQVIDLEVSLVRQHEVSRLTTQALAEANRSLRSQAQRLEQLSSTDHLTGLHNRRYLAGRLEDEASRAERHGFDLSLALIDVDGFKNINDRFSHSVGDSVLCRIADTLRASFRRSDVVARWGGEEFAILLPSTTKQEAFSVAEKAREAIAGYDWRSVTAGLRVTVSVGVVSLYEDANLDGAALLKMVDRRLYLAKDGGRDRTVAED